MDICTGDERTYTLPEQTVAPEALAACELICNDESTIHFNQVPDSVSTLLGRYVPKPPLSFDDAAVTPVNDNYYQKNRDRPEKIITDSNGSPFLSKTKSVRFAPTKRVRQFDIVHMKSTIPLEEELDVDFDSHQLVSKTRKLSSLAQAVNAENAFSLTTAKLCDTLNPSHINSMQEHEPDSISSIKPLLPTNNSVKNSYIQVALVHSHAHTQILHRAMKFIHRDRDLLLESLLKWCGFFHGATRGSLSPFLTIVHPKLGTRNLLEDYHECDYLDLLQCPMRQQKDTHNNYSDGGQEPCNDKACDNATMKIDDGCEDAKEHSDNDQEFQKQLSRYGLEDDCPIPKDAWSRALLWKYCLAVAGGSCHAASLLDNQPCNTNSGSQYVADVSIHWGGGRHHAHSNKAGGFCYINDVVLAIRKMLEGMTSKVPLKTDLVDFLCSNHNSSTPRILYIDLDIHHPDGVQSAFYSTDQVLTASFHRYSAGFFPASSGSITEKGQLGSQGLGYNLNIPLPAGIGDITFLHMYRKLLFGLTNVYDPQAIVLCVGADGLNGDPLVNGRSDDFFGVGGNAADYVSYFVRKDSYDGSSSTGEGWSLSPECLAECVRIASALCAGWEEDMIFVVPSEGKDEKISNSDSTRILGESVEKTDGQIDVSLNTSPIKLENASRKFSSQDHPRTTGKRRKLLVLGGGGYSPSQTSRTWLLCTAAACEGARPGLFWSQLPRDIPNHCYFPRYGPTFELVSNEKKREISAYYSSSYEEQSAKMNEGLSQADQNMLHQGMKAIDLACVYIERQRTKSDFASACSSKESASFCYDALWDDETPRKKARRSNHSGRRKKTKTLPNIPFHIHSDS